MKNESSFDEHVGWNGQGNEYGDDAWERARRELVEQREMFDEEGNVTPRGKKILVQAGWTTDRVAYMESLQKNYVGGIYMVPAAPRNKKEKGTLSARNRLKVFREAEARAAQALHDRG